MTTSSMRRRSSAVRFGLICSVSIAALSAGQALAQTAPRGRPDATVDEIVVTAGKREEKLREVAGSVNAATGEFMDRVNAKQLADIAAFVPGLNVQGGRAGNNQVTLRGVRSLNPGATTATYIDETPFGSSIQYSSGETATPDLDPSDIERIEVLKGPQGTLYGSSALGGLLKYVTKTPSLTEVYGSVSAEVNAVAHGGDGNEFRGLVSVPLIKDVLAVKVSGFRRHDAGFVDDVTLGQKDVNEVDVYGFKSAVLWQPTDTLRIRLNTLHQWFETGGTSNVDTTQARVPVYGELAKSRYILETGKVVNRLYSGTIDYDLNWAQLTSNTAFTKGRVGPVSDNTRLYGRGAAPYLLPNNYTVSGLGAAFTKKVTQEVRLASPSNKKLEWIVGVFYQDEDTGTDQRFQISPTPVLVATAPASGLLYQNNYTATLKEKAVFGNVTYYLTPDIDITGGYRYSKNNQFISRARTGPIGNPASPNTFRVREQGSNESINTYLGSIRWRMNEDSMVYAKVSTGYRPGGPRDIAPGSTPPADFVYSFGADQVTNYEAGVRTGWWDNRVTVDLSAYRIDWSNLQALQPVGNFTVFSNIGDARIKGVEFLGTVAPVTGLNVTVTSSYTDAHLTSASAGALASFTARLGDRLPNIPKWSSAVTADYAFDLPANWSGFAGVSLRYMGKRVSAFSASTQLVELPAYTLADIRLGAERDGLTIQGYVRNLTDKIGYIASATPQGAGSSYSLAVTQPRTIGVMVTKAF